MRKKDAAEIAKNFGYGLAVDTTAAFAAAGITGPLEVIKKLVQVKQQAWYGFTFKTVKVVYCGVPAFMYSVGTTTVAQGLLARGLQHFNDGAPLTFNQQVVSAGFGGFFSSFSENVILRQQKLRAKELPHGPIIATKELFRQGIFRPWLGLQALIIRETVFGTSYMSAEEVRKKHGVVALLLLGAAGSLVSHPFDRIATEQQNNEMSSPIEAGKTIYRNFGIKNFWSGGAWRVGLFTGCMLTISGVKELFDNTQHATTPTQRQ